MNVRHGRLVNATCVGGAQAQTSDSRFENVVRAKEAHIPSAYLSYELAWRAGAIANARIVPPRLSVSTAKT